jgi:hypothetical protein
MVFKMVPSTLPRLSSNSPPPPGCKQWFIRELNMILCVWFESAVKGMFARTCFAYPDKKGSLCVVPFFGSFKETSISRGTADIIVPVILESGCGKHLVMDINLKEHEDGKYKVWFDFELYLPNGSRRPLDSRSSPRGIHFISEERRDDFEVVDYDDEEFDVRNESDVDDEEEFDVRNESEADDEEEFDVRNESEVDVVEVTNKVTEEDFELEDNGVYPSHLNCKCPPPCLDDEVNIVPPPPALPPHILPEQRRNRWKGQSTPAPTVPNHTPADWSEEECRKLRWTLLELRSLMCIECNGVYRDPCIHLIWRSFSQRALKGKGQFLPKYTQCYEHHGSILVPVSQTVDAWYTQHCHESYEEFIESTRAFFIEKNML